MRRALPFAALAALLLAPPAAAQYGARPGPSTSVRGAAVGGEVLVSMTSGLAPGARVSIGFGGLSGGYELLGRVEADAEGGFSTTLTVPDWAERNLVYLFFVNVGGGVRLFSDPFVVTGPLGALQVRGTVAEVSEGCVLITAFDDTRYALSGGVGTVVSVGARVAVDGNVAPRQGPSADGSLCGAPAVPVRVRTLRVG